MKRHDVIVVGLGAMGSAAAWHLAERGVRVLGLERFAHPGHDRGSSHGLTRIIRQAYFEGPAYVPLVLRSYELFGRLRDEGGRPVLQATGGLMLGAPQSEVVTGALRSCAAHGLPHEILDDAGLRRRFPPLRPASWEVAVLEPNAGVVRPEATVRAQCRLAAGAGAELRFGHRALGWSASGGSVRLRTEEGTYAADRLILAAGPWNPGLLGELGLPLRVTRQIAWWFDPVGGADAFQPGRFPVYVWDRGEEPSFYGFPHDGHGLKVAQFYRGEECDPDAVDRTIGSEDERSIREVVRDRIPALDGPRVDARVCIYTETPDRDFVLGVHPEHPEVIIASPCSGHGFKFAPAVGEVLADLATSRPPAFDLAPFAPERLFTRGA